MTCMQHVIPGSIITISNQAIRTSTGYASAHSTSTSFQVSFQDNSIVRPSVVQIHNNSLTIHPHHSKMSDADAQSRKVAAEAEQYLNSTEAKQGHAKGDSGVYLYFTLHTRD